MTTAGAPPLIIVALALLGILLSPLSEIAVSRLIPRLGSVPPLKVRITTAAVTGAIFALFALRFGMIPELPAYLLLALLAVQLSRIDIQLHLLPNALVLVLLVAGFLMLGVPAGAGSEWQGVLRAVLGGAILFVTYLVLGLISPGGIGMGDVKLAAPLGMYLGYSGWQHLFYGGALGFVAGGVVTIILLRVNRTKRPSEVAYGPSMLAAALGVILALS